MKRYTISKSWLVWGLLGVAYAIYLIPGLFEISKDIDFLIFGFSMVLLMLIAFVWPLLENFKFGVEEFTYFNGIKIYKVNYSEVQHITVEKSNRSFLNHNTYSLFGNSKTGFGPKRLDLVITYGNKKIKLPNIIGYNNYKEIIQELKIKTNKNIEYLELLD